MPVAPWLVYLWFLSQQLYHPVEDPVLQINISLRNKGRGGLVAEGYFCLRFHPKQGKFGKLFRTKRRQHFLSKLLGPTVDHDHDHDHDLQLVTMIYN